MSGYFTFDHSAPLPLALDPEMVLFSSSTPSPSTSSDFTFVEHFSLATSPASMSPGDCSPFDRVDRDLDSGSRSSFSFDAIEPCLTSSSSASSSSIGSLNATTAPSINPRMFFSRTLSADPNDIDDPNDAQFRRPSSSMPTSEPSPCSSSAESPYSGSTPVPCMAPRPAPAQTNQKRATSRRPTLTSSRSAPVVSQQQSPTSVGSAAAPVVPTKNAAGKFQCTECSRSYLHAKHLKRHMLRHTGDRPYKCSLCSDSFCRSDILKRHYEKCQHRRANAKPASKRAEPAAVADKPDAAPAAVGMTACDECARAGIRCAREDGHICVRCGHLGAACSVAGIVLDVPQFHTHPGPPPPQQQQQQQQGYYFPKSEILDDDDLVDQPVVFPISNEFQPPMNQTVLIPPQAHMYDFTMLSYYSDMVDTQMQQQQQQHAQSPMQFYT